MVAARWRYGSSWLPAEKFDFHRVVRNAERLWAELARHLAAHDLGHPGRIEVIDTKPLAVARGKRWEWAKLPGASKGFSTMGTVWGFKPHAVVSPGGLSPRWAFVPAHEHGTSTTDKLVWGPTLGDGAYVGTPVYCPSRRNMKRRAPWPKALSRLRKRIETSFGSLVRPLNLHVRQVKTFWSLRVRVNLKIAAHNLIHSHSGVLA